MAIEKKYLTATAILLVVLSLLTPIKSDPICQPLVSQDYVFNIRREQKIYVNLFEYFKGYNLKFSVRDDEETQNNIQFIQTPVVKAEQVEAIVQDGQMVSYDAWQNQDGSVNHVILARDENDVFTLKAGQSATISLLPEFQSIDNFIVESEPTVQMKCFQVFFVKPQVAVVDCLVNRIASEEKFSKYYIVNLETGYVAQQTIDNYFPNLPVPTKRINVVFKDENQGMFVISTIPYDANEVGEVITKSEINIYEFQVQEDSGFPDGELFDRAVVDVLPGETDPLFIVDLGVSEEEIYVLSTEKIFRFKFDGQNIVELTRSPIKFRDDDEGYVTNFAVYQDVDELYLMLAEDNKVSIYFWPPNVKDTPMKLNAIVRLRNLEDIKEIKFGEDFAFLVSDGDIVAFNWLDAIYSASQHDQLEADISIVHVNYEEEEDLYFESFSKDYVFVASENKYGIYFFSDPILLIENTLSVQDTEEFDIVATSSVNGKETCCILRTYIKPIFNDDGTKLYSTGRKMDFTYMPGTMGTNKRVYMDGEYEGPNIQYTVGPDVKHNSTLTVTNYTMISTMPIDLSISENTQDIVFTQLWTLTNRRDAFYVFTQNTNKILQADRCVVRSTPDQVVCLQRLYSPNNLVDEIEELAVDMIGSKVILALTYKSVKYNSVDFFFLNNTKYATIDYGTKDANQQISDIQMINGYIFVIQKKAKNVNVYALDFQMKGEPVFKLNDETVGKWPCFGDVDNDWNHIQIYGHKSSPNMFYVETFRCLVEIEIIGSRPHFVTSYDLGSTRGAKSDRAVVVTDRSLIVASITVNEDQSISQKINEIFNDDPLNPLTLKPVELYGYTLTFPIVYTYNYFSNNFYAIMNNPDKKGVSLVAIKSGKPDISRINAIVSFPIQDQNTDATQLFISSAGYLDDYLMIVEPGTTNRMSILNPTNKELIYYLENQKLDFKYFTGIQYLKVGIKGGVKNVLQSSRVLELVVQNPQTAVDANYTLIHQTIGNGIIANSLGNEFVIDDQNWFDGTVLNCQVSSRTPNYKNFAIRNHIETLNSSLVNSYAGAIDLLTIDSRILILIDNGTIVQLNSNLTEVKKFTLNQTLMENRYPYQMVSMSADKDSILVILKNNVGKLVDYAAVVVTGASKSAFECNNEQIFFTGIYTEIFQVYVYKGTHLFIGWGTVPRYSDELGYVSIYQFWKDKNNATYLNFLIDINGTDFTNPSMSISGFHFEDGLYNNSAQALFVMDDRGDWLNYAIMNIYNPNPKNIIMTPVVSDFKSILREHHLFYNLDTVFFGLRQIYTTELNTDTLNITFQITTSNTAIYEIRYIFYYKTAPGKPKVQPLVIFNSYGPNYKIRKPAFVLGDFVLAEFISTKESANRTDILAIYSRLDSGLLTHTGAKLVKLKGGIVKGANPYNIDLFAMVFSNVDYRPNIVYQDTAPTPDSNGRLINTLFSATYHDTITLLTYSSRFPVQDVTIAFQSFYTLNDVFTIPFLAPPPDTTSSGTQPPVDPQQDNLEVLWILLGTFGGLLILAAAYILIQRNILLQREQGDDIQDNQESYEQLN